MSICNTIQEFVKKKKLWRKNKQIMCRYKNFSQKLIKIQHGFYIHILLPIWTLSVQTRTYLYVVWSMLLRKCLLCPSTFPWNNNMHSCCHSALWITFLVFLYWEVVKHMEYTRWQIFGLVVLTDIMTWETITKRHRFITKTFSLSGHGNQKFFNHSMLLSLSMAAACKKELMVTLLIPDLHLKLHVISLR